MQAVYNVRPCGISNHANNTHPLPSCKPTQEPVRKEPTLPLLSGLKVAIGHLATLHRPGWFSRVSRLFPLRKVWVVPIALTTAA